MADDGVAVASETTPVALLEGSVSGDLSGIVSPLLTIDRLQYGLGDLVLDFTIGTAEIPVSLDLSGFLAWQPEPNLITLTDTIDRMMTGDVVDASYIGLLSTPFGNLPFNASEADGVNISGTSLVICRGCPSPYDELHFFFDALDQVAIDLRDTPLGEKPRRTAPTGTCHNILTQTCC